MADIRKRVAQETLNRWGELSRDLNPLHVDPSAAASSPFGGTILHGHFTVSWLMEWSLAEWGPAWLSAGELERLRFLQPLRPDVEYRVSADAGEKSDRVVLSVLLPDGTVGVTTVAHLREES
jgi:acyl dehydratase